MSQDKTEQFNLRLRIPLEWKTRLEKESNDLSIKNLEHGRTGGVSAYVRMILAAWLEVKNPPDPHDEQSAKYMAHRQANNR